MKAFIVHPDDNVATALEAIHPGKVLLLGCAEDDWLVAQSTIELGHKIAIRDIGKGDGVLKYGARIGHATVPIQAGQWVHLHNCASDFDERSNTLDSQTGAPTETNVYR